MNNGSVLESHQTLAADHLDLLLLVVDAAAAALDLSEEHHDQGQLFLQAPVQRVVLAQHHPQLLQLLALLSYDQPQPLDLLQESLVLNGVRKYLLLQGRSRGTKLGQAGILPPQLIVLPFQLSVLPFDLSVLPPQHSVLQLDGLEDLVQPLHFLEDILHLGLVVLELDQDFLLFQGGPVDSYFKSPVLLDQFLDIALGVVYFLNELSIGGLPFGRLLHLQPQQTVEALEVGQFPVPVALLLQPGLERPVLFPQSSALRVHLLHPDFEHLVEAVNFILVLDQLDFLTLPTVLDPVGPASAVVELVAQPVGLPPEHLVLPVDLHLLGHLDLDVVVQPLDLQADQGYFVLVLFQPRLVAGLTGRQVLQLGVLGRQSSHSVLELVALHQLDLQDPVKPVDLYRQLAHQLLVLS